MSSIADEPHRLATERASDDLTELDDLDLRNRLAARPPRLDGVQNQKITLRMDLPTFDTWLRGILDHTDYDLQPSVQDELFPMIPAGRARLQLLPSPHYKAPPSMWPDDGTADGLPRLADDWVHYRLRAQLQVTTPINESWEVVVGLITFRRPTGSRLTGTIQYLDVIKPWIVTLRGDLGDVWQESNGIDVPPVHHGGRPPGAHDARNRRIRELVASGVPRKDVPRRIRDEGYDDAGIGYESVKQIARGIKPKSSGGDKDG